jgi:hypothetical protein
MNGRIYDPVLGRFMSGDPYVDSSVDSQSLNRYSYVSNNPLGYTDPSGYFKLKDALKIIATVAVAVVAGVYLGPIIGQALGGALNSVGLVTTWTAATEAVIMGIGGGMAGGFASGFTGSLLNGSSIGDAFKAGVIGGAAGAVTGGFLGRIGAAKFDWFRRGLAHGSVHGAVAEATGGEFRHGFYSGFAVGATESKIGNWAGDSDARGITAAAIVGGTASALGGGKFTNGAVSGAFSYLFNWLSTEGVGPSGRSQIEEAQKEALALIDKAIGDLNGMLASGEASSAYIMSFGPYDYDRVSSVLSIFESMKAETISGNLVYRSVLSSHPDYQADAVAWVAKFHAPHRINLQAPWWRSGLSERATTIIHELAHLRGGIFGGRGITDYGYSGKVLMNWAKRVPQYAIRNAESYSLYVQNL